MANHLESLANLTKSGTPDNHCPAGNRVCKTFPGGTTCTREKYKQKPLNHRDSCCPGECVLLTSNADDDVAGSGGVIDEPDTKTKLDQASIYVQYEIELEHPHVARANKVCKKVEIVDEGRPIVTIKGHEVKTVLATDESPFPANFHAFQDQGATCYDGQDGDLSWNVTATITKKYDLCMPHVTVEYHCFDYKNRPSYPAIRKWYYRPGAPNCTARSGPSQIEASFPYVDPGADCFVGSVPVLPTFWSDQQSSGQYSQHDTGSEIVNVEKTGTYVITYRARNGCGDIGQATGASTRTIIVVDTLKPVLTMTDTLFGNIIQHAAPSGSVAIAQPGRSVRWDLRGLKPVAIMESSGGSRRLISNAKITTSGPVIATATAGGSMALAAKWGIAFWVCSVQYALSM